MNVSTMDNCSGTSSKQDSNTQMVTYVLMRVNFWCLALIILVGLTGNALSIITIWNTKLRRITSNHYLMALSVSDSVFLLALFIIWLSKMQLPLYHKNGPCHVINFSLNCSSWLSSWYMTAMTIERYIVVYFPLSSAASCTLARTKRIICSLVPWPVLFNVWVVLALGINEEGQCDIMQSYYRVGMILNFVDTVASFVLPTLIIVGCNSAICVKMCSNQEAFKAKSLNGANNRSQRIAMTATGSRRSSPLATNVSLLTSEDATATTTTTAMLAAEDRGTMRRHTGVAMAQKMQRQERKITQSLMVVSFVFLTLNLPSYSLRVRDYFLATSSCSQLLNPSATELIVQNVFTLIYYSNFAINFFVYSLSSANFRKAAAVLLRNQPLVKHFSSISGSQSTSTSKSKSRSS